MPSEAWMLPWKLGRACGCLDEEEVTLDVTLWGFPG